MMEGRRKAGGLKGLIRSEHAAIAPLTALSLVGLIAVGGLAFDYSRMVSLDTDLQDAADHAALAAASQLDREADQCARAEASASALVANDTRFATDGGGSLVTIDSVVCDDAARRVDVTVAARTVDFSLTPFIGMFNANLQATAAASVGSAICKVPPFMMCNPGENAGDPDFTTGNYVGKGIELVGGGGGAWAPGNFGFLDVGADNNGTPDLREALAKNSVALLCIPDNGVDTDPGLSATFANAFNTRFDIYDNGYARNNCFSNPACGSDLNVVKDLVRTTGGPTAATCNLSNQGWHLPANPYQPDAATRLDADGADIMGHPRDICHAVGLVGDCAGGPVGDGIWDRNLYFQVNHGIANPLAPDVTRWQVYNWEKAGQMPVNKAVGGGNTAYSGPQCSTGLAGPPERRKASMAVVNCIAEGVNGATNGVTVNEWVDVFLVEPSVKRSFSSNAEIYIEVIGKTQTVGNGNAGQIVRRDTPYLIE